MPGHVQQHVVQQPTEDDYFNPPQKRSFNSYAWLLALVAFLAGVLSQSPLLGVYARAGCRTLCGGSE